MNDSLGKGPFLDLTEIVLSNEASSKTFEGEDRIEDLFDELDDNLWEFRISTSGLDE